MKTTPRWLAAITKRILDNISDAEKEGQAPGVVMHNADGGIDDGQQYGDVLRYERPEFVKQAYRELMRGD